MPPANSPDPDPFLSSTLRQLESPINAAVLNLASTLGTRSDDGDDALPLPSPDHIGARFSARTREYMSRHNGDGTTHRPSRHTSESHARFMSESARQQVLQHMAATENRALDRDLLRRNYRIAHSPPTVSPLLEQTVRYVARLRHAVTTTESLEYALEAGFLGNKAFPTEFSDFFFNTSAIAPPAETSWLAPGAVLSGCQHATNVSTLPPPTRPWLANTYSTPRSRAPHVSPSPAPAPAATPTQQDRWPVRVTIHAIDWTRMTLSATMEAYNVPSHPHPHQSFVSHQYTRTSSITTYLEGEILDFVQHTLVTESFPSTLANDATYWRKLPPFSHLQTDEDIAKALTSRKFYDQVLNKEYVLMRWKERCFVKPLNNSTAIPVPCPTSITYVPDNPYRLVRDPTTNTVQVEQNDNQQATFDDSGCGLTISGFYYVCLRRSDGELKGLYFDPQSSPYQCLELESKKGGAVGAWSFR